MYLSGVIGLIVLVLGLLMVVGVLPMTPQLVGGMFIGVALGFFAPFAGVFGPRTA